MFGSDAKREGAESFSPAVLESLEPRLMLTTLALDAWLGIAQTDFVFRDSEDQMVRVTLANWQTGVGAVELMRVRETFVGPDPDDIIYEVDDVPGEIDGTPFAGGISGATFTLNTNFPQWPGAQQILAIAYDPGNGVIWAFDNATGELVEVDATSGMPTGTTYHIEDSNEPTFEYDVTAMDVDGSGTIYAVGTLVDTNASAPPALPDPAGPFLITIDPTTGVGTQVNPGQTVVPTGTNVNDIAFDGSGNLYGTDGTNLLGIGPASGSSTQIAPFTDVTNNQAITNMTGLQVHLGQLYGQAGDQVFVIDVSNGNCSPVNGTLSQTDMTDLASDGTLLYGVFNSNDNTIVCTINTDPPENTDIFCVYIGAADAYTTLTFCTITEDADNRPQLPDIQLWGADPPAALSVADDAVNLRAPAGSGGVLIGGVPAAIGSNGFLMIAADTHFPYSYWATPLGLFPGGQVHAGIMSDGPMGEVVQFENWMLNLDTGEPEVDFNGDPIVMSTEPGLGQSVWALAADSGGTFYGVDNFTHTLMQATYDAGAAQGDALTTTVSIGELLDAAEPSFRYDNVYALDFDSGDTLYGIATITDTIPGPPTPPTGTWLVTIDTATGQVTRQVELSGATNISTIVFDDTDAMWGIDADTNWLVTIDTGSGNVTPVAPLMHVDGASMPDIDALEFTDLPDPADPTSTIVALVGVGDQVLFAIDQVTGEAAPLGDVGFSDAPGLAASDAFPGYLWTVTYYDQTYRLVQVDPLGPPQDIGRILVAGTVAGQVDITGSIEVLETGFIWGNVNVSYDAANIIVHTDVARDPGVDPEGVLPENALIHVEGTLHELDVYGIMYGSVDVRGEPNIPIPWDDMADWNSLPLNELEPSKPGGQYPYVPWAVMGELKTVNNDTVDQAQFLFNESGNVTLWGTHYGEDNGDPFDWYGISLMAGQTVRIDGYRTHITDPRMGTWPFVDPSAVLALALYDSDMNYMGSVGYETVEDWGFGSKGVTQEPLEFTAPRAGIYYMIVADRYETLLNPESGLNLITASTRDYTIFIRNGTSASAGAVRINGDYDPMFFGDDVRREYDLAVSGGNLGAVQVDGISGGVRAHVFGDYDLVAFRASEVGRDEGNNAFYLSEIVSQGNIGLVEGSGGDVNAVIVAGADEGLFNNDAYIQNVISAQHLHSVSMYTSPYNPGVYRYGLWASGSIGSVFVADSVDGTVEFTINGDGLGPTGYLDLVDVRGNWGGIGAGVIGGVPMLYHGTNADVRMIHVGGIIFESSGLWTFPLDPTRVDNGSSSVVDDDGGGQVRISPSILVDANGDPVLVPDPADPSGVRMITVPSPYEYTVIPVYYDQGMGKTGGVLVNLTMDGPGSVNLVNPNDEAHIGRLVLTGPGGFRVGGTGALSVYHVEGTDVMTFRNTTWGDLASGNFTTSVDTVDIRGNLGRLIGETGQWVWGVENAPGGSEMGYFAGRIHGLQVTGDIQNVNVDGWLGDLLVTGRAENVTVNADDITPPGGFDGVVGVIHGGGLGQIDVGDGLADDGPAYLAIAAILSDSDIQRVLIDGRGKVLNGSVLAIDRIENVTGRNGAFCTAIISATQLDAYKVGIGPLVASGSVGTVDFSGEGAAIDGSEIYGQYIETISTSANSDGMSNSYFSGLAAPVNDLAIERVLAGGPGMYNCTLASNGGSLGVIRGVGSIADLWENLIDSTVGVEEISGRDVYENVIQAPGEVRKLIADRDMFGNLDVHVGSIGTLTVGRDFAGNYVTIASRLDSAKIGRHFADSTLDFQGPRARLGDLVVEGDISGRILSAGSIDSVVSRAGVISADIETIANNTSGDVDLISTFGGYTGALDVAGGLKKFVSHSSLGVDPSTVADFVPERFNITGDLGDLSVQAVRGGPPVHLYTTLYVGGNAKSVNIDGSLYADLLINGELKKLTLEGDMGGIFNVPAPTVLGNVIVLGEMGKFSIPSSASIVADLTVGGSISRITLKDRAGLPGAGNIEGDITSLHGSIEGVSLTNGVLSGNLTAAAGIGKISLKGSVADPASITGDIVAQGGGIAGIDIRNGDLDAEVSAMGGDIKKLRIRDGDAVAGHTIYAVGNIGTLSVQNGNLDADVVVEGAVGKLDVKGSDLTGDVTIGTDVKSMSVAGDVNGSTIWVGGFLKSFKAGALTNAVVSSLYGMGKIDIVGDVANSEIVGGYHAATGALHSANIKSIKIGGDWTDSVVAVGVDPVDGDFTTDPNAPAPGLSSLGKMDLKGILVGAGNRVIADTATGDTPVGMPTATVDTAPPPLSPNPANHFGPGTTTIGGVEISLKGEGVGSFDPVTNELVLNNTGEKTKLTVSNPAAAREITLVAGDDDSFSGLTFSGNLTLGDAALDGMVKKFTAGAVADGAIWQLLGTMQSMVTEGVANATVVLGELGSWKISGGFLAGGLTADAVTKGVSIAGNLGAPMTTVVGGIKKLDVDGAVAGDVTSHGDLERLTAGSVSGDVLVESGDLGQMRINGDLSGNVDVPMGYLGKLDIRGGSFGSPLQDKAIRALTGIGQYSLSGGVSGGLISTGGAIKKINVKSTMQTRVRAENGIGSVNVDVLSDAILSSGTQIGKVTIRGDMIRSDIVAGFDPSDAGYDGMAGGEAANVRFDGRTFPVGWRTPQNQDQLNGGDVVSVKIGGDMIASSIAAGVGPGADGWFGTDDDQVRGSGYVRKVRLGGSASGSADPTEHYGVYAASGMPVVSGSGLFFPVGNFDIGTQVAGGGSPRVTDVDVYPNRIHVVFDHDLDFSTINTAQMDPTRPTTFDLVVSRDGTFGPAETDDVSVSDTVACNVTYDSASNSVILTLVGRTWYTLNLGTHFQLTIDGSEVTDRRGNLLDGEFGFMFPSGNGLPGGDFVYHFAYGDAGGTEATATDLSAVMVMNQSYQVNAEIGDNISGDPTSDVDVYRIPLNEGDVFYWYSPNTMTFPGVSVWLTDTAMLAPTASGLGVNGQRASSDGDVYVHVNSFTVTQYTLYLLVFNDGNSNFDFDDATQVATPLAWIGNVTEPDMGDQEVVAPDDVDLYSLGVLPANTELTMTLETILIGSPLTPKMAVFNSTGDLVGSIMFGDDPGGTDIGGIVPAITLTGSVLTPADDTYYVAVAGLGYDDAFVGDNYLLFDMGKYRLTITQQAAPAPVYPKQVVYLNFTGGVADFLVADFGDAVQTYQMALSASLFGFAASGTQDLLNAIVDTVETIYLDPVLGAGLTNIEFTTVRPLTGSYSTVFVGGNLAPEVGLVGLAEKIDPFNGDLADDAVVWGGEVALVYSAYSGYTVDDVGRALGNLAAHELGHVLGLNHVEITFDNWVMGYGDIIVPNVFTTHAPLMTSPSYEFLIGYQNSVASLAPVA